MTSTLTPAGELMTAVVKAATGAENVVLDQVPVAHTATGLARVRVVAAGVCGTDTHIARDEYACEAPVVMGHEILGEVDQVGSPEDEHWLGKRVVCETYFSACEVCEWCRAGSRNLCRSRRSLGSFENGGFARYVTMPALNLHAVPDTVTGLDAVLAEPLACVAQCLLDPPVVNAGDRVLVTGPGAMGQLAAQVAKACGGEVTLAGLERDAQRLRTAAGLGIRTTTAEVPAEAFDVVIECSGSGPGARAAMLAARRGARYVQVGIFGRDVSLPFDTVLYKELVISSGFASTATSWRRAIALMEAGLVALGPLVTRQVPIADFADAFAAAAAGDGIKTVIIP